LILSWLKHIKGCQVVQLNWAVSSEWHFENKDIIAKLMEETNELFSTKYGYDVFKKNSLDQLISQSEADAVGITFDENGAHIYAVDIAFHEGGLNYGSRSETVARIVKKCIRTAMCILGCFNIPYGDIIFTSPKITPAVYNDLMKTVDDINGVLREIGLDYDVQIIANENFRNEILVPVTEVASNVADTSELFMRGLQLFNLFEKREMKPSVIEKKEVKEEKIAQSSKDIISGYEHLKVAEIARTALPPILESGEIDKETIELMETKEYSKEKFDLQYPLLLKKSQQETRPVRYMAKPIISIYGEEYYLCSEWFEKPGSNNDRPYLLQWIKENQ
ncbi:MAG: hypothetical protein RR128_07375, partial [Clostridium sp.]